MVDLIMNKLKDLGLNRQVLDSMPTAVVGGAFAGSLWSTMAFGGLWKLLNHVVPHGQQLKLLYLRVSTSSTIGTVFAITQTNPSVAGTTGTTEAFPVVGSVPPFTAGVAVRDYPFLEAAGAEVLKGSLKEPIHVFEGSVDFYVSGPQVGPSTNMYSVVWWGVEETPEG